MTVLTYVVSSLAWSVAGFALGWFIASTRQDVRAIKETVVDHPSQRQHLSLDQARVTRALGVVVILLAFLTVFMTYTANQRISDVAECQAEYNTRFAEVVQVRAALQEEDRAALQDMLLAIYRQRNQPRAERLETFENWVKTIRANNRERAENPLPELPEGDCR